MVKKLKLEELTIIFKFLTIKPINRTFLHNYKKIIENCMDQPGTLHKKHFSRKYKKNFFTNTWTNLGHFYKKICSQL